MILGGGLSGLVLGHETGLPVREASRRRGGWLRSWTHNGRVYENPSIPMYNPMVIEYMQKFTKHPFRCIDRGMYPHFFWSELMEQIPVYIQECKRAVKINLDAHQVVFSDGAVEQYRILVSTIPITTLCRISHIGIDQNDFHLTPKVILHMDEEGWPGEWSFESGCEDEVSVGREKSLTGGRWVEIYPEDLPITMELCAQARDLAVTHLKRLPITPLEDLRRRAMWDFFKAQDVYLCGCWNYWGDLSVDQTVLDAIALGHILG
jgi:hypothetical protein